MNLFSLLIRVQGWYARVVARPTGKLVFAAGFGLGVALDDPLLVGPTLDGWFPLANFVGDVIGMLLLVYLLVGVYGLYVGEPFGLKEGSPRDEACRHDSGV